MNATAAVFDTAAILIPSRRCLARMPVTTARAALRLLLLEDSPVGFSQAALSECEDQLAEQSRVMGSYIPGNRTRAHNWIRIGELPLFSVVLGFLLRVVYAALMIAVTGF